MSAQAVAVSPPASAPQYSPAVVRDAATLAGLAPEWQALFDASPKASPPLCWEWVSTWWGTFGPVYGDRGRGLRILTVRQGGNLVGVLPLYLGREGNRLLAPRRLGFVSTGAAEFEETCTEYLDLLHAPGEASACVEALAPVLTRTDQLGWDEFRLSELPHNSPLFALTPAFRDRSLRVRAGTQDVCHLFNMDGGFEAYLQRLSHENRRQARKMLRDVAAEGMGFEVAADPAQLHSFFDQLVELHRKRWAAVNKPGSFTPRHARFHRTVAELLFNRGGAVIARLTHSGEPLAVVFGYRIRDCLHCYQQGVAPGIGRVRSPGTAAWLLLMRHLAERGVTVFDHLRGRTPFKDRFATDQNPVAELRVVRVGLRTVVASTAHWTGRVLRRAARLVRRPSPRAGHRPSPQEEGGTNGSPS
jgi:CelD/BcsL family acetyltransferase involved in cellulose biosynthesis